MKLFKKVLIVLIAASILASGLIYINILRWPIASEPQKSAVIVVLGCQVWGKSPSLSLEYRLEKSLELYNKGLARYIIVSGGQGNDEIASESSVMKKWLVERGIDENKVFEENKATCTYENLKYSKDIMEKNNLDTAIVVSNDFHIFRSLMLAKRLGIEATACAADSVDYLRPYYQSREIISCVKSFVFDR